MAAVTRARVVARSRWGALRAFETVWRETPAACATSSMVTCRAVIVPLWSAGWGRPVAAPGPRSSVLAGQGEQATGRHGHRVHTGDEVEHGLRQDLTTAVLDKGEGLFRSGGGQEHQGVAVRVGDEQGLRAVRG